MTDTDQSGRTLDYTMERDVIGTFYNYAMKVYPKDGDTASYDAFYDAVSDPNADSHEMTFPYGQETLTFRAYVTQGKDKLRIRNGKNLVGHGWPVLKLYGDGAAEEAIENEMGYKVESNGQQPYASVEDLVNMEQQLPPYALCLPRYAKMDGNYPNAPDRIEKGSYGYISTALSGPDGRFGNPPAITVTFDRLKTSNGVYLVLTG